MKTLRVLILALSIAVAGALVNTTLASAAEYGRTLTGELVYRSGNQFRIVGVGSGFTAPSGTPLASLDGKTVQVELSPDGRVTQITQVTVPINPVLHGWSTVRGQVAVANPYARTFTFAGDTQTYTAPASVDIALYNGKYAEAKMDENGNVTELHLVPGPPPQAYNPYSPPVAVTGCTYNGETFSTGSAVCQSGTQYRCDGVNWQSLGTTCQPLVAGDAPRLPPNAPRSCVVGDATVANGSSICRTGTTFRCDDGAWINMQTACR